MSKKSADRINLHEMLKTGTFDNAVLCTYSFNPRFFEDYCLEKFDSLSGASNLTVLTDQGVYQEVLAASDANRPRKANIRYLLHPVEAGGVFHPKIYLLTGKARGRLILGSANLTRPGLTSNGELAAVFEYQKDEDEDSSPVFQGIYEYLVELSARTPSQTLESNVRTIARESPWILREAEPKAVPVRFVHNLDEPLWPQIVAIVEKPVERVDVLSLFFDSKPGILNRIVEDLAPKKIRIFTENNRTALTADWLDHPLAADSGVLEVYFLSVKDEDFAQPLHAKALYIEGENQGVLAYGSANFTTPGLLGTVETGNAEVLLLLKGVEKAPWLTRLFDPCESAYRLVDPSDLTTRSIDHDDHPAEHHLLSLREVEVVEDDLQIDLMIPETVRWDRLGASLRFLDDSTATTPVIATGTASFRSKLLPESRRRLDEGTTAIRIIAWDGSEEAASSNSVLVTNLLEFRSGESVRKSRRLREAHDNVDQFFQVLRELLAGTDESALIAFLNLCDIPVLETPALAVRRPERRQWDGGESMRSLGRRNLSIERELHPAAIAFFDRHFRKLERHVKTGSIKGVSNYLHIFFAMGGVLRSQVERLIQGLEAHEEPIDIRTWSAARRNLDEYYLRVHRLFECLYKGYLPKLSKAYGWSSVGKSFHEDLSTLDELRRDMVAFRDRLEDLRREHLRVATPTGHKVTPEYFSCVFERAAWKRFLGWLEELASIEQKMATG